MVILRVTTLMVTYNPIQVLVTILLGVLLVGS